MEYGEVRMKRIMGELCSCLKNSIQGHKVKLILKVLCVLLLVHLYQSGSKYLHQDGSSISKFLCFSFLY